MILRLLLCACIVSATGLTARFGARPASALASACPPESMRSHHESSPMCKGVSAPRVPLYEMRASAAARLFPPPPVNAALRSLPPPLCPGPCPVHARKPALVHTDTAVAVQGARCCYCAAGAAAATSHTSTRDASLPRMKRYPRRSEFHNAHVEFN